MYKKNIKEFAMTNLLIESSLVEIEQEYEINLGRKKATEFVDKDEQYYPQFSEKIRHEAAQMSQHYEMFYCLEQSIRDLISNRLFEEKGANWWENTVPDPIKAEVERRIQTEIEQGVTQRSEKHIDYSTFGELSQIIEKNWELFDDTFTNLRAVKRVLSLLNTIRAPIAHCCPLAEDEVGRLQLSVKDWFRLMT